MSAFAFPSLFNYASSEVMRVFIYSSPQLFGSLIAASLSFFVLSRNWKSPLNRTFSAFGFLASLWLGAVSVAYSLGSEQKMVIFKLMQVSCSAVIGMVIPYLRLTALITQSKSLERWTNVSVFIAIFFMGTVWLTDWFIKDLYYFHFGFYPKVGWIHPFFLGWLFVSMALIHLKLFLGSRDEKRDSRARNQAKYIWLAFIAVTPVIVDFIPNYGIDVYPAGFLFVLIFGIVSAYAVVRHQLMDIKIVIKKTLFYSALTALVSIVYIVAVFLFHSFYSDESFKASMVLRASSFPLTPFALSGLLTGLSCTVMAVWLIFNKPSNFIHKFWAYFCLWVSIWGFGSLSIGLAQDSKSALILWRVTYIGVTFIPVLFYHFILIFLGLSRRRYLILAYITSAFFLIATSSSLMMPNVTLMFGDLYIPQRGIIYPYFVLFFFFMVIASHLELWRFMKTISDDHRRTQIKWFFIATAIGFTGGASVFLPAFGIKIYPYGNFGVALYPIIMTYAIVKHELLDIRIIIRKTVFYTLFTFLLSFLSLALVLITHSLIADTKSPVTSFIANFVGILFIAIMFKPLELFFQKKLEKRFFKGTVSEIAEQNQRLAIELERRERLKTVGILAAGMAHEIKNPLTAIKTFAEYLPQRYEDPIFREKFVKIINEETDRIAAIVKDLLLFSKPSPPKKQVCNCLEILKSVTNLLSEDMLKNNIKVEYEAMAENANVFVDPSQIKQAILNIILNAIDAMGERGGILKIRVELEELTLKTTISDTGPGIPTDKLKHLFDPFYTTKDDGTGLGLAITHTLIEANNGKITVENSPSHGASFSISLPTYSAQ